MARFAGKGAEAWRAFMLEIERKYEAPEQIGAAFDLLCQTRAVQQEMQL